MNKNISIIIGLVLIAVIGVFIYMKKQASLAPAPMSDTSAPMESTNPEASGTSEETSQPAASGIAMSEVAQHNSRGTCWAAINGSVYDLTSWIPKHPGGEQAILQLCGTDGSAKFNRQHGGNNMVLSVLAGFKIGLLAQ